MNIGDLVNEVDGEARASSEVIASGVGIQHKNVMALVRKYESQLTEFGLIAFQTRPRQKGRHGGGDIEYVMLNEQQASLLILLMRNAPRAVEFKVSLIREFFRMRSELQNKQVNLWQQMQDLIAKEVNSQVRASFGSHLMLKRKQELPVLRQERYALEVQLQPSLLSH